MSNFSIQHCVFLCVSLRDGHGTPNSPKYSSQKRVLGMNFQIQSYSSEHSRMARLRWSRRRAVFCSESSRSCSAEAREMTFAASLWISSNRPLASRDTSDSCQRIFIKLSQFTASREGHTASL
ncbi:hypothetical protein DNTS_027420, partial [Danionella cerebrum]